MLLGRVLVKTRGIRGVEGTKNIPSTSSQGEIPSQDRCESRLIKDLPLITTRPDSSMYPNSSRAANTCPPEAGNQ